MSVPQPSGDGSGTLIFIAVAVVLFAVFYYISGPVGAFFNSKEVQAVTGVLGDTVIGKLATGEVDTSAVVPRSRNADGERSKVVLGGDAAAKIPVYGVMRADTPFSSRPNGTLTGTFPRGLQVAIVDWVGVRDQVQVSGSGVTGWVPRGSLVNLSY